VRLAAIVKKTTGMARWMKRNRIVILLKEAGRRRIGWRTTAARCGAC